MVIIIVQDIDATPLYQFIAKDNMSFLEMMEEQDLEYPYSCRAWACFSCVAKIIQWIEYVDFGKLWMPLIDLDADQVLTCVWWIKSEFFDTDANSVIADFTVVLQKI